MQPNEDGRDQDDVDDPAQTCRHAAKCAGRAENGEDQSQVRCGSLPQVLAALRNTALGLLRRAGHSNIAAAARYYAARPCEALALLGIPMTTK